MTSPTRRVPIDLIEGAIGGAVLWSLLAGFFVGGAVICGLLIITMHVLGVVLWFGFMALSIVSERRFTRYVSRLRVLLRGEVEGDTP